MPKKEVKSKWEKKNPDNPKEMIPTTKEERAEMEAGGKHPDD